MITNMTGKASLAAALLLAAGGSLFAAPVNTSVNPAAATVITIITVTPEYPAADEASRLLKQIQKNAVELSQNGATLTTFTRSGISSRTHGIYLNAVKNQINETGKDLARLEQIKADTAPWQQEAINQLTPIAREVASNTEAAINQLNDNSRRLFAPAYTESLQAIADNSSELKNRVNDFLSIAAINQKADDLHEKAIQLEMKADEIQMRLGGTNS